MTPSLMIGSAVSSSTAPGVAAAGGVGAGVAGAGGAAGAGSTGVAAGSGVAGSSSPQASAIDPSAIAHTSRAARASFDPVDRFGVRRRTGDLLRGSGADPTPRSGPAPAREAERPPGDSCARLFARLDAYVGRLR